MTKASILPSLALLAWLTWVKGAASPAIFFEDRGLKAGLNAPVTYGEEKQQKYILESTGTGLALLDYDDDGHPDIFVVNGTTRNLKGNPPSSMLYHNRGNGSFVEVTKGSGLERTGWGQATCVGDFDNDGKTDLLVTYYGENVLYKNQGNGKFVDVSRKAGIQNSGNWNSGCTFWDYDRDGNLDLFVATYLDYEDATRHEPGSGPNCRWKGIPVMCGPMGLKHSRSTLYQNNGDGTFADVSTRSGIGKANGCYAFQPVTLDYDSDGWSDLFVSCDSTPNLLFHNNHDGTFAETGTEGGVALNEDGKEQASMGVAVGDYNLDGFIDLLVTNFSEDTPALYQNNRDGTFVDSTYAAKLGLHTQFLSWGTGFVDLDLDGWKDLFIVSGHVYPEVDRYPSDTTYRQARQIYRNLGNGTFSDVSALSGPAISEKKASRGLAFEDLDGDGTLEAVIVNLNEPPSLLKNTSDSKKNWMIVKLEGARSNRSAIGARVRLKVGDLLQSDEVRSASSYYSSSGLRLHFGLGTETEAKQLEVNWPSGTHQVFENVKGNRVVIIHESQGIQ